MFREALGRRAHSPAAGATAVAPGTTSSHWSLNGMDRVTGVIRRNWLFSAALVLSAIPRVIAMLGFQPAVLFKLDSYDYLWNATHLQPDAVNTSGYSIFLWFLRPLHSLVLVTVIQHLLGLAVGVMIYAVLRRWGVRPWVATVAALPVLFAAAELMAEQLIMADFMAMALMVFAFGVLLLRERPSVWRAVAAGLLLGASVIVRPTTLPLIVLMALYLLLARVGWRRAVAVLAGGALPVVVYMAWFASSTGSFNLTNSNGLFLWSRTMSFANCAVIKPPADLAALCPNQQPGFLNRANPIDRVQPKYYLWDHSAWQWKGKPLTVDGPVPDIAAFTTVNNQRAQRFAILAIERQPLAYLHVVAHESVQPFVTNEKQFLFPLGQPFTAQLKPPYNRAYALAALRAYTGSTSGVGEYLGGHYGTRVVQPWAGMIRSYQQVINLPGAFFGLIILAGLIGLLSRRYRNWPAALLWVSAVIALVVPIAEHDYTYRYVLPSIPLVCMAAALCFGRQPGERAQSIAQMAVPAQGEAPDSAPDVPAPADHSGGTEAGEMARPGGAGKTAGAGQAGAVTVRPAGLGTPPP
jgi:hypothetical protein